MRGRSEVTEVRAFVAQEGRRSVEASVSFGLGHRLRIEILAALHDRPATAHSLAKALGQSRQKLRYHLDELLKDGAIEIAGEEPAGNMVQHVYRVTTLAYNSDADWQAMPLADRQVECAVILQAVWTEALASLWAGGFNSDPDVINIWNRILLDDEGRERFADELVDSWQRFEEIEGEAAHRRSTSKDCGARYIMASFGYERARSAPPEPQPQEIGAAQNLAASALVTDPPSGRSPEETVSNAVGHRLRVELLAALHEGPATTADLGRTLRQPVTALHYHVRQLVEDGSIIQTGIRRVRNFSSPIYSVVHLPLYNREEWLALSAIERQAISAVTLRAAMAESLASLWAGKLHSDPRLMLAWKPVVLDGKGHTVLAAEQAACWERVCDIEKEAARRLAGRPEAKTYVITLLGFKRSRIGSPEPLREPCLPSRGNL